MTPAAGDPFDFDAPIERRGTDSTKWARYAGRDVLPMWVADMDFRAPPAVIAALEARVRHGVFGYADPWPSLNEAVVESLLRDHGWRVEPEWIVWLPGLVCGLNLICRAVGRPGDAVFSATPIYPPFLTAPEFGARIVQHAPLARRDGRWGWDFDAVERAMDERCRLFMLCNPHNPTGRVFGREELAAIAELAERRDLVICSDEVHCDLVLEPGRRHLPIAALDESVARRTITLMAPSKTYNIPGLGCAYAVVSDPALRRRVREARRGIVADTNVLGLVACEAALRHAAGWRAALREYLRGNRDLAIATLQGRPGLSVDFPEATYLAWIDARDRLGGGAAAFFEQAGVGLSDGAPFGAPGFVRLNFGCPRATLGAALERMVRALERGT